MITRKYTILRKYLYAGSEYNYWTATKGYQLTKRFVLRLEYALERDLEKRLEYIRNDIINNFKKYDNYRSYYCIESF